MRPGDRVSRRWPASLRGRGVSPREMNNTSTWPPGPHRSAHVLHYRTRDPSPQALEHLSVRPPQPSQCLCTRLSPRRTPSLLNHRPKSGYTAAGRGDFISAAAGGAFE
ncbi:hypothetical protein AAFF_G00035590 [Aldrovandia affinis]|uniref:Uncharacterized protein n=1 Tax=Aldrovandia affinis TaxID=143900 RepID=A0AAD7S3E6_9TELE|nr:hypothetical protein AAFF_G00035590 [Aldrovandia affinis]